MRGSIFSGLNRQSVEHGVRTTVAAMVSLAIAQMLRLPEPYWATVSTMVVTQSTLGAALTISGQRFAGTALGASAAVLLANHLGSSMVAFATGVFGLGLVCAVLRLAHPAYRFAGITLAIVVLVPRGVPVWIVATHRFLEVSLGIAAGLAITAVWPERERPLATRAKAGSA